MRTPRPVLLVSLLLALVLPATAADASCLFDDRPVDERLDEFPYVFRGTVTGLGDEGRTASFRVEEVWRGELGPEVVVYGGPAQDGLSGEVVATSVDRTWQGDATYLVMARVDDRGLVDDSCSPTREWTDDLAVALPADGHAPDPALAADDAEEDPSGLDPLGLTGLAVLVGAVAAAALVLARRRSRAA